MTRLTPFLTTDRVAAAANAWCLAMVLLLAGLFRLRPDRQAGHDFGGLWIAARLAMAAIAAATAFCVPFLGEYDLPILALLSVVRWVAQPYDPANQNEEPPCPAHCTATGSST